MDKTKEKDKDPGAVVEKEGSLDEKKEEGKRPDFSYKNISFVNSINKQRDLLLDFLNKNKNKKEDDSRLKIKAEMNIDVSSFDEKALLEEGKRISRLLEEYKLNDFSISYYNKGEFDDPIESVDIAEIVSLLKQLEEAKDKILEFDNSADNRRDEISDIVSNLKTKKSELVKSLDDLNSNFLSAKLFKRSEARDLKRQISDLNKEISEQEKLSSDIFKKSSDLRFGAGSFYKPSDSRELLLKAYLNNIEAGINDLEKGFLNEEMIEKMNEEYINENVLPYLFDHDDNKEYSSEINEISQEDKESYLRTYKEYFSLPRGFHADTYDLSPEEKKEHEEKIETFERVERRLNSVYLPSLKEGLGRFDLYKSRSNDSFNNEYIKLTKNLFSEFYDTERKSCYLEIKDNLKKGDEDFSEYDYLLKDSDLDLESLKNTRRMYPGIKDSLISSGLIKKEKIDEIEESIIKKLYDQYVLKEKYQGKEGQEAIHIMGDLDGKKAIPFFLEYIKNNKSGHTRNSCLYYLIEAIKDFSEDDKNILEKTSSDDRYLLKRLMSEKKHYLLKGGSLVTYFLKDPHIFKMQEEATKLFEEDEKSEEEVLDFYKFQSDNMLEDVLRYIEISGRDKEETLRAYQKFSFKHGLNSGAFLGVTKMLGNYQETLDLILEHKDYGLFFEDDELLEKFGYQFVADKLIEFSEWAFLATNIKKLKGLDHKDLAFRMIEAGGDSQVASKLDRFEGLDHKEVALKIIESGDSYSVANYLGKFEGLDSEVVVKLIDAGKGYAVIDHLEVFKDLNHEEIALKLIDSGDKNNMARSIEKFKNLSRDVSHKLLEALTDFSLAIKVNDYFDPPLDRMVNKTSEIFGDFASVDNYKAIKRIKAEDDEIIEELKLKKGGNDGLRELQEKLNDFKREIILEDFDPGFVLQENSNSLYLSYFKSYIRVEVAEWGRGGDDLLKRIVEPFKDYKEKGELKTLNPEFTPSEVLDIKKSDKESMEKHEFNEHFLNRFATLTNSIKSAKNLYQEKFPLSKLVERIEEKRLELVSKLKEKSDKMPNPKAKEGIGRKIKSLESINIRSLKDFQDNFSVLAKAKDFNELLRQTVFLMGFAKNRQSLDRDLDSINLDKPELDDISWVLNFSDHITNQETMRKYFTDSNSAKLFNEIISTKAITEEMAVLQGQGDSKESTKLQFIPTRGILTEFSGHIADACWASKYKSMLKSLPNFTSVIIRQNPETKFERLAGAFMLIETESKEGEPLLVIRGFNPIENMINSVSVEDFYEKASEYIKELASKAGRKAAVVIDHEPAKAATNRPLLFKHLDKLKPGLRAVELKSNEDTEFNNKDIRKVVYLID